MQNVYVLGDGQLARMLRQAAEPLGVKVKAIGLESKLSIDSLKQELTQPTSITAEIERWPATPITDFLSSQPCFVNQTVFAQLADRYTQKKLIDRLNLNTAPWQLLPEEDKWQDLFNNLDKNIVIKTRTGGYDGRGQWRVNKDNINESLPKELVGEAIAEAMIPFNYEISLVGARNYEGEKVFYPITHNYHQEGILRASVAFSVNSEHQETKIASEHPYKKNLLKLQEMAENMLGSLLDDLQYVGVLAMECFVVNSDDGPRLLINELAPRVHNSGHWTQNGASISQFELHIRAICGLPLLKPIIYNTSVMINIIGTPINYAWLNHSLINLHWYDKEPRIGRKLGHLNISSTDKCLINEALDALFLNLPDEYSDSIEWVKNTL
ncbi:5-(carboxyamino)imidazole ribonucleotide synthase [Thorsellia kenyensis]|uniref:N5-carboxyaminoimidazole ribonucleotide synthase n=1 Tax=Thorsellia kenyensis TaxID=1549888 RepID=A0ABV6C6Z1_9GAMM